MIRHQRAKGIGGEREVRRLLNKHGIAHQWMGWREQLDGAAADIVTDVHAIEVKRRKQGPFLADWWRQAQRAADKWGRRPAVVYRFDRQPWRMRLTLEGLQADVLFDDWLQRKKKVVDTFFPCVK